MKIFVSSCLLGYPWRYDGSHKRNQELINLLEGHEIIHGCCEYLANFSIPHLPIELKDQQAFFSNGADVTEQLKIGAKRAYQIYQYNHCDFAILKSKSPSCGRDRIYDGSFTGQMIQGDGFVTQLFKQHHIEIFNENELNQIKEFLKQNAK